MSCASLYKREKVPEKNPPKYKGSYMLNKAISINSEEETNKNLKMKTFQNTAWPYYIFTLGKGL